jgi:hypothetical protein
LLTAYLRLDNAHFVVNRKEAKYFDILSAVGGIRGWMI